MDRKRFDDERPEAGMRMRGFAVHAAVLKRYGAALALAALALIHVHDVCSLRAAPA